jgi:heterodisulfide reductase subunit D
MNTRLEEYEDWARACMHVRCGFCRENCPAYNQLKMDSYSAKGKLTMLYHWLKGSLEPSEAMAERVFACTSCGLCDVACGYPQSEAIQAMKIALSEEGYGPPEAYEKISQRITETGNPYGEESKEAEEFLSSFEEARIDSSEVALFFGCTDLYRNRQQVTDTVSILRAGGVNFMISRGSLCCGSPAYRIGDLSLARVNATSARDQLMSLGVKTVITSCAGCFRTMTHEFDELLDGGFGMSVVHSTNVILDLLENGKLKLNPLSSTAVFHDPCHLGRQSEVYETPREILKKIPGLNLVEMEWNRKFAKCCGAGGGFRAGMPEEAIAQASDRIGEAESTGASLLATSCPFCFRNLSDGARKAESELEVTTIEGLIADLL